MEIVAQHLQREAFARQTPHERDLFGRSAFNRYYYATFLDVKVRLAKLRPEWGGRIAHRDVPEALRGAVVRELACGRRRAEKADDLEVVYLCQNAKHAARSLAQLMDESRETRVAADYALDIPVLFSTVSNFSLNTVNVQTAQSWPHKARGFMMVIESAWRQIHA